MCITFQNKEDMPPMFVSLVLYFEDDIEDYRLLLTGMLGFMDISDDNDIELIREAVEESLAEKDPPKVGRISMALEASGEWEGFAWHRYFTVKGRFDTDENKQ